MALGKTRARIFVQGLGTIRVRELEPTPATDFVDIGYLEQSALNDEATMEEIIAETGQLVNFLERQRVVAFQSTLLQAGKDEIDVARLAGGKVYAVQYYGKLNSGGTAFQFYSVPNAKFAAGYQLNFVNGKRGVPIAIRALKDLSLGYDVPEYTVIETAAEIEVPGLKLWVDPRIGLNAETAKLLDISGFANHGDIAPSGDATTIWQGPGSTPDRFLRFDGVDQATTHGDVLDDDGTGDMIVEAWLKFPTAGVLEPVLSKKSLTSDDSAGFCMMKSTGNAMQFKIASGAANATFATTSTFSTTWKHLLIAVDRNGNITGYTNGVADGTPVSCAAIATGTNALNLCLARESTATTPAYGEVDLGAVRVYRFAAGGLPADVATIALRHYNADKTAYGLS